jgi:hypothetical protein
MTAKNRADIQTEIDTELATNGVGTITAANSRTVAETSKDSNLNLIETANQAVASKINGATISSEQVRMGMMDYADNTAGAAVSITGGGGFTALPNDGAGAGTNKTYKVTGVGELWNAGAGLFDWSALSLGDQINIRLNIIVTTTAANQVVSTKLNTAIGGTPYDIFWQSSYYKTSGVQDAIVKTSLVYMGDINTLNNGARFEVSSPNNCTVQVVGWALQHFVRN